MSSYYTIALLLIGTFIVDMASADEKPVRPRVLILGGANYHQPATEVTKQLKDRVEVVHHRAQPGELYNTSYLLKNLDTILGEKNWDLIYFNSGLGDLIHRAPGMKSIRIYPKPAGGIRTTAAPLYRENLLKLVKRLKATNAKLVWASTTPIRHSSSQVFELKSEIEYNQIAATVMAENKVPIFDMYQYVYDLIDMNKPASHGADPFSFDKKPVHEPIIATILKYLPGKP